MEEICMKQDELISTEEKIDQKIFYFQSLFGLLTEEKYCVDTNDTPTSKSSYFESKNQIV